VGSDGAGVDADGNEVLIHPLIADPEAGRGDETLDPRRRMISDGIDGTFAEVIAVPRRNLVPKPQGLSWESAACLGTAWLTAYRALFGRGDLPPGRLDRDLSGPRLRREPPRGDPDTVARHLGGRSVGVPDRDDGMGVSTMRDLQHAVRADPGLDGAEPLNPRRRELAGVGLLDDEVAVAEGVPLGELHLSSRSGEGNDRASLRSAESVCRSVR